MGDEGQTLFPHDVFSRASTLSRGPSNKGSHDHTPYLDIVFVSFAASVHQPIPQSIHRSRWIRNSYITVIDTDTFVLSWPHSVLFLHVDQHASSSHTFSVLSRLKNYIQNARS